MFDYDRIVKLSHNSKIYIAKQRLLYDKRHHGQIL